LSVSQALADDQIQVEHRDEILPFPPIQRARDRLRLTSSIVTQALRRASASIRREGALPRVRVVDFENAEGETIRAIIDSCGDPRGAPAVVVPPAWGRTKETLLPLAATIVATFKRAHESVSIVRFDGIRRRGESHRDRDCLSPERENHRFTFSQAVHDIESTVDFLMQSPMFRPSTVILVTFSAASIEGRRAVARNSSGRIGGWISVVGAPDAQSLTRVISGGVDYFGGIERGIRFGVQDIQGLVVDMDNAGPDALANGLAFLEDARRDFAQIQVPVTWIHGRFDAWMSLDRVRDAISCGSTSGRKLIEVPTGHQLKDSRAALDVFRLIASEVSTMALGRELPPAFPELSELERRTKAERMRLPPRRVDVRGFWKRYLLGGSGNLGMEIVTASKQYRKFMDQQIESMKIGSGERICDLGSGIGALPRRLLEAPKLDRTLHVVEIDYIMDALKRARGHCNDSPRASELTTTFLEADLNFGGGRASIPLRTSSQDVVLASLLINYVLDPEYLLQEIYRVLRPGGRMVISSLRRDADISDICVTAVAELRGGRGREAFGFSGEAHLAEELRGFISEAGRLFDLAELGFFRFWDSDELQSMVKHAGFQDVRTSPVFGDPPQATMVSAIRR
jgi:ubiquinone/menaquinone biosynthesis C-methylase UbiE/pimeloyl-ACP methyl ester carboxylesterase